MSRKPFELQSRHQSSFRSWYKSCVICTSESKVLSCDSHISDTIYNPVHDFDYRKLPECCIVFVTWSSWP